MQYREALATIGGLSHTSKMPWYSWSISARDCITGSKLAKEEGTVCNGCYALKGNYNFSNVKAAHDRKKLAIQDPRFTDAFVIVLNELQRLQRKKENRFRWFDSGDLQSVEMLTIINNIARQTPNVRHWLPTREMGILRAFLATGEQLAENLVVRVSAAKLGSTLTKPFGLPTSSVGADDKPDLFQCPALKLQGNQCLSCTKCWEKGDINYPLH
jgi:hypothetical protein